MNSLSSSEDTAPTRAFTRIELLAVLAILALIGAILAPALAGTRPNSQTFQCLNNHHHLIAAWQMYADDNAGRLVNNLQGAAAENPASYSGYSPWAAGWLDWTSSTDNTNLLYLVGKYGCLAPYLNRDPSFFKCPADKFLSVVQKTYGYPQRVRSVSCNIGIGDGNAESGPWFPVYKHIKKLSDFAFPNPSDTWVFLDEHPDSINDPGFFNPGQTAWQDLPATYHNDGASFAFADGHTELHLWTASLTNSQVRQVTYETLPTPSVSAKDADLHWMAYHAGRVSTNSY